jgi:membrane peptidoglycan carboxypeptidase
MDSILSDDANRCMEFGCGGDLTLPGRRVAAKTGTTQDFRDNWTIGFTPTLATAVWVGNPNNVPLYNSTGIIGAAPIWHRFMQQALRGVPNMWYAKPSGLDQIGNNYFLPGTEYLPPTLAARWPACRFSSYDPYTLTYQEMLVNGLPCVLRPQAPPPPKPKPAPSSSGHDGGSPSPTPPPTPVPTPAPTPCTKPHGCHH